MLRSRLLQASVGPGGEVGVGIAQSPGRLPGDEMCTSSLLTFATLHQGFGDIFRKLWHLPGLIP